jgi:hypothetical protein
MRFHKPEHTGTLDAGTIGQESAGCNFHGDSTRPLSEACCKKVIVTRHEKRDAVMQRMGAILTETASEAGWPHEMAREFARCH